MLRRVIISAVLLASSVIATAAEPLWIEVKSPNFTLMTDAGEASGREVIKRFEQMRLAFGVLFSQKVTHLSMPLQIIAFRRTKEFKQFVPLWQGKPISVAGLFHGDQDRAFILLDLSLGYERYETVFHEYAHLLLNGNYPPTAVWFDEGFAEYFSTIDIDPKWVHLGKIPQSARYVFEQYSPWPVTKLFAVAHESETYNKDSQARQMLYAESWLVVHSLITDPDKMKQLNEYFRLVNIEKVPIEKAIEQAFKMTAKQFDQQVDRYMRAPGTMKIYAFPAPPGVNQIDYTVQSLSNDDARALLADSHVHSPDYVDAGITELQQILSLHPDHALSHRGLGYAYMRKGDFTQAGEHFRRAAQLDSKDPRVHFYSAMLMNRGSLEGSGPVSSLEEMKKHLETAINLDPRYADAFYLRSFVAMQEGDWLGSESFLRKALAIKPREEHYLLNLATTLMNQQKWDEAQKVLEPLVASESTFIAQQAEEQMRWIASHREGAIRLANNRDQITAEPWRGNAPAVTNTVEPPPPEVTTQPSQPDTRRILFLKGTLVSVDCSDPVSAILTVARPGGGTVKMLAKNRNKLLVMGEEKFSCDWKNRKVAINYRQAAGVDGELFSVELQ